MAQGLSTFRISSPAVETFDQKTDDFQETPILSPSITPVTQLQERASTMLKAADSSHGITTLSRDYTPELPTLPWQEITAALALLTAAMPPTSEPIPVAAVLENSQTLEVANPEVTAIPLEAATDSVSVNPASVNPSSRKMQEKAILGPEKAAADPSTPIYPVTDHLKARSQNILTFSIPGNVVPKARPRVTSHGTFLPQRYRVWRNKAEVEIYKQLCDLNPPIKLPIQKAAIAIRFFGKHRTNSDLDNLAGACLDALTLNGAGVLQDDRLSCIPKLTVEYIADTKETGVWIEIEPL